MNRKKENVIPAFNVFPFALQFVLRRKITYRDIVILIMALFLKRKF